MVMPSLVVVMLGPSALVADVDTVATLTLLVLAGVVFRWRALGIGMNAGEVRTNRVVQRRGSYGPRRRAPGRLVAHTRCLMDVMGILPPARQMAGVARGLNGVPWRSDLQTAAS